MSPQMGENTLFLNRRQYYLALHSLYVVVITFPENYTLRLPYRFRTIRTSKLIGKVSAVASNVTQNGIGWLGFRTRGRVLSFWRGSMHRWG